MHLMPVLLYSSRLSFVNNSTAAISINYVDEEHQQRYRLKKYNSTVPRTRTVAAGL
jgi:hypothetical protein